MSVPTNVTMPAYIVCRNTQPGAPVDPTAELIFWPPKDSDELFDALRMEYPHLKTHSERMREAVIKYLLEEQQVSELPTPVTANSTLTSPWQASMQSMSSGSSTWSSPELFDLATPTFSPQPQSCALSRQQSTATTATAPSNSTPPAIEQMTGVFSLSDAAQPKQRMRRKMTEAEKVEYRKRRIVKACDKCSKRKRKCTHNQQDVEVVGTSKVQKVTKPALASTSKKPPPPIDPQIHQNDVAFGAGINFDDSFGSDLSMPQLADYSGLFEDPLPGVSLDELLMPTNPQWPWSDTADWTLMDSGTESVDDMNQVPQHTMHLHGHGGSSYFGQTLNRSGDMFDHDFMQITGGGADQNNTLWEHMRTGQEDTPTEKQQPMQTGFGHDMDTTQEFKHNMAYNSLEEVLGQEDIEDAQLWPQQNMQAEHSSTTTTLDSLSQMTLRLTGTAKAVKAFGSLLPSHSSRRSRLQSVSLKKVALLALGGLSMAQGLQQRSADEHRPMVCTDASCAAGRQFFDSQDLRRHHMRQHRPQDVPGNDSKSNIISHQGALVDILWDDIMTTDHLRMKTNVSPVQESGCAIVSRIPTPLRAPHDQDAASIVSVSATALADVERNVKSKIHNNNQSSAFVLKSDKSRHILTRDGTTECGFCEKSFNRADIFKRHLTSVHGVEQGSHNALSKSLSTVPTQEGSKEAKALERCNSVAQEGRQTPSLGEGLTAKAIPSTELYLLKRRIPKALHSIVDHNSPSSALGPLLTTIPENVGTFSQGDQERAISPTRNIERTEGSSSLTDGGAYLTSAIANSTLTVSTGGLGAASSSAQPVHIRPRNPTLSGFAGSTDQHNGASSTLGLGHNLSLAVNTARVLTSPANAASQESGISAFGAPPSVNLVEAYRLCDHVRRRDHFGRPSRSNLVAGLMFSLAAFATLVLLSFARTSPTTLSLLFLALLSPVSGSNGIDTMGKSRFGKDGVPATRDIENSSWHTALQSHISNHLPARVHMQRLLYCESQRGRSRAHR